MNFKSIGLSAMLAGTAAAVVVVAPARAASIGGQTLGIAGTARLENANASISRLNFASFKDTSLGTIIIPPGSGNVFGADGTLIQVKDFDLTKTGPNTWKLAAGPITDWLTGIDNGVKFTLDTFSLTRTFIGKTPFFNAYIAGIFGPSSLDGTGAFSAQGNLFIKPDGETFSAGITADEQVPTPALLPGLVGMGVAALRKRKSEELEPEEA